MQKFFVTDGEVEEEIDAENEHEAAQKYVAGGDYETEPGVTHWVEVWVSGTAGGLSNRVPVAVDPDEPEDCEHDWRQPVWLGPVRSYGGWHNYREVCAHCGAYRLTDTAAVNPSNGERGTSVEYLPADNESLAWVAEQ